MKKKLKAGFFSGNVKKCEQVGRIQTFYGKRKVFGKSVWASHRRHRPYFSFFPFQAPPPRYLHATNEEGEEGAFFKSD